MKKEEDAGLADQYKVNVWDISQPLHPWPAKIRVAYSLWRRNRCWLPRYCRIVIMWACVYERLYNVCCAVEKERGKSIWSLSKQDVWQPYVCMQVTHIHTPSQTRHPSGDLISYSHTNTLCKCAQSCLWFQDSFADTFKHPPPHTHIYLKVFCIGTRVQGRQCSDILSFWMTPPLTSYDPFSFEALGQQKERQHCKNILSNMTLNSILLNSISVGECWYVKMSNF